MRPCNLVAQGMRKERSSARDLYFVCLCSLKDVCSLLKLVCFLQHVLLKDVFHVVGAHIGKSLSSYFTFQGWVGGTMFSPPGGF